MSTFKAAFVVCCLAGLTGCPAPKATTTAAEKKARTRAEFRDLVKGKTPEEVVALVGRPDRTSEVPGQTDWVYNARTRDPVSGKLDLYAVVVFRDGWVEDVLFS